MFGFGHTELTEEEKKKARQTLLDRLNDGTQPVAEQLKQVISPKCWKYRSCLHVMPTLGIYLQFPFVDLVVFDDIQTRISLGLAAVHIAKEYSICYAILSAKAKISA